MRKVIQNQLLIKPHFTFKMGTFFLPTVPFLSLLLFIYSIFKGKNKKNTYSFFKDPICKLFIISFVLILVSTLYHYFYNNYYNYPFLNNTLALLGLFNWMPFIFFWGFRSYLDSPHKRTIFAKYLIAGSLPVLVLGIFQKWFNLTGPFTFFDRLIVWHLPLLNSDSGITSIFNNPNYLGIWLTAVLPFCIYFVLTKQKDFLNSSLFVILLITTSLTTILTLSRNAWIGFLFSIFFLLKIKKNLLFAGLLISFLFLLILLNFHNLPNNIKTLLEFLIPSNILIEFTNEEFLDLDITRSQIWLKTITLIAKKPIFGWGPGTFSTVFAEETGFDKFHSHNFPLEIAFGYGILPAIIISLSIFLLLIFTFKKVTSINGLNKFKNISLIDQAWFTSSLIVMISHLFDVTYYDGRISSLCWILMAGLLNISKDSQNE